MMKKYRQNITYAILCGLIAGCGTTKQDVEQNLAAISTVSAMVIALPLIPFAEAYHFINQTEKKLKDEREHWERIFDPVYAERTRMIEDRVTEEDAKAIFNEGVIVYFPSLLDGDPNFELGALYPGVEKLWNKDPDKRENWEAATRNELANYLWTLMSKDPKHSEEAPLYFSETWEKFIHARFSYMETFNQTMYKMASNQLTHSIADSVGSE